MTGELREQNNDTIFQDAVDALRRGEKARAKELLTRLLKTDQNNAEYWIWLSAAVDSPKERVYCLQTALKLDPENTTAKRGLILHGALSPDDSIQPFPMNRPRAWEAKLRLANKKPRTRGFRNPAIRLAGLALLGAALCSVVVFGFILPRQSNTRPTETHTPGPSPTFTGTPTLFGATARPTQERAFLGPTPLEAYLPEPYTPTPLYVNTPRSLDTVDQFRIAREAYEKGDWDTFLLNMELIKDLEPESADVLYYIGEAYRFKGESTNALAAYNDALKIDPNFGPPYLGLARVRLLANPRFNAEFLFEEAIDRAPDFGEIYLERARFYLNRDDIEDALADLETAETYLPGSPEVYLTYANAYLALEETETALEYAERAYAADITNLPVYKLLGDLYIETENYQRALESLQVYTAFETDDAIGFAKLGQVYFNLGEYQFAIDSIDRATEINRNGVRRYYVYRGLSHLELGNADEAVNDMEVAVDEDDQSFIARLGFARAYYLDEKYGTAFLQIDIAKSLTETDEEEALMLFWRARIQEKRGEDIADAIQSWRDLLELDEDVMTPEMREEAEARLKVLAPATRTPTPGASTSTPRAGTSTPTPGTSPTPSRTPTRTPTPTPTP